MIFHWAIEFSILDIELNLNLLHIPYSFIPCTMLCMKKGTNDTKALVVNKRNSQPMNDPVLDKNPSHSLHKAMLDHIDVLIL